MILKVRNSDGKVVARFPTIDGAAGEAGHTLVDEATLSGTSAPGCLVQGGAIVPDPALIWAALRDERNRRLTATDWTQVADMPEPTQLAWRPYRQALRDLPENTADPSAPNWPAPPA
jgi:hypothetical protein